MTENLISAAREQAAALTRSVGALAAAIGPSLRTWFDTTAPGASSTLPWRTVSTA